MKGKDILSLSIKYHNPGLLGCESRNIPFVLERYHLIPTQHARPKRTESKRMTGIHNVLKKLGLNVGVHTLSPGIGSVVTSYER